MIEFKLVIAIFLFEKILINEKREIVSFFSNNTKIIIDNDTISINKSYLSYLIY